VKFGPNIANNGLVLALDAANPRSFRGEPTENLVPTSGMRLCSTAFTRNSSHVETWTYSRETNVFGRANVTKATITPTGTTAQPYADWGFAAYKTGGSEIGDVYTVSFDFKVVEGTTTPTLNTVYANGYKTPDSSGAASLGTQYFKDLGDGWTRYSRSATITVAGNTWWRFGMNSNNNPTTVYVDNFQVELKSSSTRFVDGTRGTTVATGGGWADLSGNAYHGEILNGTTTSNDETITGALDFDGVDDYITLGNNSGLGFTNGIFSVETWVYIPSSWTAGSQYPNLISKGARAGWDTDGWSLFCFRDRGNPAGYSLGIGMRNSGTTNVREVLNVDSDKWLHVVGTLDGSTIKIYINGIQELSNSQTINPPSTSTEVLIGKDSNVQYFPGRIAGAKLYNKSLTASEILQNYNATKGRFGL